MIEDKIIFEDGSVIHGADEIPEEVKIFNCDQLQYIAALTGQILLHEAKGQLLNILEGIGLPEKQETAVKRMVTNVLHEIAHHIRESIELVTKF